MEHIVIELTRFAGSRNVMLRAHQVVADMGAIVQESTILTARLKPGVNMGCGSYGELLFAVKQEIEAWEDQPTLFAETLPWETEPGLP
jgi:hypothetical protein